MKFFIIETPKMINGEVLALKSLARPQALEAIKSKFGISFDDAGGASFTINSDGDGGFIFQGVKVENNHGAPRISYYPIFPEETFFAEVKNSTDKNVNVFIEHCPEVIDFITNEIVMRIEKETTKRAETSRINFVKDLLDFSKKSDTSH